MAPLKLEDNIREQFEDREIKPSAEAWKKLSEKLDENSSGSKRRFGIWWAIAAGIAALAIVGTLLFSSDPIQQNNEIVVEQQPAESPVVDQVDQLVQQQLLIEESVNQEQLTVEDKPEIQPEAEVKKKDLVLQNAKQETVARVEPPKVKEEKSIEIISPDFQNPETITAMAKTELKDVKDNSVEAKVAEVVEKIKDLEAANATVSEAEIADLLDQAHRELKAKSQINMQTLKVDANALLMDVEYDLERSFRDKVFDALGDGYNKIRTAMATRNN